jgi:hypothetical protein
VSLFEIKNERKVNLHTLPCIGIGTETVKN